MYVIRSEKGEIISAFASKQDENEYPGQEKVEPDDAEVIEFISRVSTYVNS